MCAQDVDETSSKHVGKSASTHPSTAEWCAPAARASLTSCAGVNAHSLRPPTGRPAGPSRGPAGRPRSSLPPLGVPGPSGRYLEGRIPRASEGARPPQCLELGAREPIMPALTLCEHPVDAGTTALGGRHGHGRGRGGRRRPRRCGRRARGAPGAGGGRWDGRARAQSACSGTSIRAPGGPVRPKWVRWRREPRGAPGWRPVGRARPGCGPWLCRGRRGRRGRVFVPLVVARVRNGRVRKKKV